MNTTLDFLYVHRREAQLQSFSLHGTAAVNAQWSDFYLPGLCGALRRLTLDLDLPGVSPHRD
jgi:hypothetical protein